MNPREIVEIRLGRNTDGSINRDGPFIVISPKNDRRNGLYVNEPDVVAQLAYDEDNGRFEATWDGEWTLGKRVADA